jgi:ABC-type lipoprotein release transport system permease subunit
VAIGQGAVEGVGLTPAFWRGRRVFLTGHTGFKGSWLALWLDALGARVTGFALAVVGIYGVMAQLGRRRTQEMGIRIALGARAAHVQWLVVRHGMKLVTGGLVVGLLGATGATRAMRALLFEVTPGDPVTFVTVPALLALTALAASWLPAARASRADPAGALRAE